MDSKSIYQQNNTMLATSVTQQRRASVKRPIICPEQIKAYSDCIVISQGDARNCEGEFAPLKACLRISFSGTNWNHHGS